MGLNHGSNLFLVLREAVSRRPHYFVFGIVDRKTQVIGDRAVEQAERVREIYGFENQNVIIVTNAVGCGGPFANSVNCKNCSIRKS